MTIPSIEQQRNFDPKNVKTVIVAEIGNNNNQLLNIFLDNQSDCPIDLVGFTCFWSNDGGNGGKPKRKDDYEENWESRQLEQSPNKFYQLKELAEGQKKEVAQIVAGKSPWGLLPDKIRMTFGIHSGLPVRAGADDLIHFTRELQLLAPAEIQEFQSKLLTDGALACFGDDMPQRLDLLEGAARSLIKNNKSGPLAGNGLGGN